MPDEDVEPEPIDFAFIYFIATAKLNLRFKEVGRLTLNQFLRMYQHYKNTFDTEMIMQATRTTYEKARILQEKSEEWE